MRPILEKERMIARSLDKVIQSIESKIKRRIHSKMWSALRFGYSIYNDPAIEKVDQFSGHMMQLLLPCSVWIVECAYVDNP